jgi:hypothetical protein
MDYQLGVLTLQELSLKKELAECGEIVKLGALEGWEDEAREYLADIQAALEWHNKSAPQSEEERREMFEEKREIVKTLVKRVDITRDRDLQVTFQLNVKAMIEKAAGIIEVQQVGTYNHTQ